MYWSHLEVESAIWTFYFYRLHTYHRVPLKNRYVLLIEIVCESSLLRYPPRHLSFRTPKVIADHRSTLLKVSLPLHCHNGNLSLVSDQSSGLCVPCPEEKKESLWFTEVGPVPMEIMKRAKDDASAEILPRDNNETDRKAQEL